MNKSKKFKPFKAIIALCEGKTDLAFLRRLLQVDHYRDYTKVVSDIPYPLGPDENKPGYFLSKLRSYEYDSGKLRDKPILPLILRRQHGKPDTYILLYDMNGMVRLKNYKEVIGDFKLLAQASKTGFSYDFKAAKTPETNIALSFFYDLGNKTVQDRIEHIQKNYAELIPEVANFTDSQNIVPTSTFKAIGYHIIANETKSSGTLEDVLLPMMRQGKEEILFVEAESFLTKDDRFVRLKKGSQTQERNLEKEASELKKSLIGAIGQIEYSGLSNVHIIKNTHLLNSDKFKNSSQCQDILRFIGQLRKHL